MPTKFRTISSILDMIYVALLTNILLVVGWLPVVAGLITTDPTRSWPLLALVAPLCAPALCAAFAVMAAYSAEHSTDVLRTFTRAWRATFRRAVAVAAIGDALLVVLFVDGHMLWGRPIGAVVIPLFGVLMVLTAATALHAFVVIAERPTVRVRTALRVCVYLAVRRWYLTAMSLVVLAVLEALLATRPALELGIAATPLLYVVWANSRFTLRPALGIPAGAASKA